VKLILIVLVTGAIVVKVFESRIPPAVYRTLVTAGILLPLAGTGYAMWLLWQELIGWRELALFVGLYFATGLGTTLGYHRLATHRSFEAHPSVKLVFYVLGSMALQGRLINWAAYHVKHHANSDGPDDPHTPLEGLFHAHVGWIMRTPAAERERYCKRLLDDRIALFADRTMVLWVVVGLVFPYLVAGWTGLLWGGFVRIAFTNHVTFAVNSICHRYGSRPFATNDESRNNWIIGALAFGEGWHNNHHAFPSMAYHGMSWRQFDPTGLLIRLLARLGLVWNVRSPAPPAVERRRREAFA
jgi:stearoyl-CoA desaturase (Delta-9 desaturase)